MSPIIGFASIQIDRWGHEDFIVDRDFIGMTIAHQHRNRVGDADRDIAIRIRVLCITRFRRLSVWLGPTTSYFCVLLSKIENPKLENLSLTSGNSIARNLNLLQCRA